MREIRLYGSEGGGAARSPYPYQTIVGDYRIPAVEGMRIVGVRAQFTQKILASFLSGHVLNTKLES